MDMFGFAIYKPAGALNYWICSSEHTRRFEGGSPSGLSEYWLIGIIR
jgi:hypothetical protein